jgi:hypothetical protein
MDTTAVDTTTRYASTPVRPAVQTGLRLALWAAVFLGAVGGIAGFFRSPGGGAEKATPVEKSTDGKDLVPGTVVAVAERSVTGWLTATTPEDEAALARLYLEPPEVFPSPEDHQLAVLEATTIAGEVVSDGLWKVTVAVEVEETDPAEPSGDGAVDGSGEDADAEGAPPTATRSTWYVQLSVVGDVDGGRVAAVATPTVISEPPALTKNWTPAGPETQGVADDDPVVQTVQEFLDALLAGNGDPSRYLAPDVEIFPADPPPFAEIVVDTYGAEEIEAGRLWVRANATGTTTGGRMLALAYDLVMTARDGRWEVRDLSPVFGK